MLDANALDRDDKERGALVDRFMALVEAGRIRIRLVDSVRDELLHPNTPATVRNAVPAHPPPERKPRTHEQKLDRIRVRAVMRGNGPMDSHEADALHLSQAAEAGCTHFITHDKRILRRRSDLAAVLPGLRIVTLSRCLELLDDERDPEDGRAIPDAGRGPIG